MTSWQQPAVAPPTTYPPTTYPPTTYPPTTYPQGTYPQAAYPQFAYPPMALPPMAPSARPLPPEHARAARRAGALGGALAGVGTVIAASPIVAWGFVAFFALVGPISRPEPGAMTATELGVAFTEVMTSPTAIVMTIVCLVVGVALLVLGVLLSVRRLRRAGVRRPVAVTLLGVVLTRVGTLAIATVLGGLLEIAAFSWLPSLMIGAVGAAAEGADAQMLGSMQLAGGIATALIAIIGLVLAAGSWLGIGILAWWWMAFAFRDRTPPEVQDGWPQPAEQGPAEQRATEQRATEQRATEQAPDPHPATHAPVVDER